MQFLRCYLDYFPENCGYFGEEQGEHIHQDISDMEKRCQEIKISGRLPLVPEEGCGVCSAQTKVPKQNVHPRVASLVHYTLLTTYLKYFESLCE